MRMTSRHFQKGGNHSKLIVISNVWKNSSVDMLSDWLKPENLNATFVKWISTVFMANWVWVLLKLTIQRPCRNSMAQ